MSGSDPPRMIHDRYQVLGLLGEGASSRTLLCLDSERDERVALKELRFEHLNDWKTLELFEREAEVLSRLDHPGIPKVRDFFHGKGESTTLYIVQEFIDGPSLQDRMESGPMLGRDDVHQITLGLLDVLEYLHGRLPPVLHRDIKPSNVLVRPGGDPALVDFGGVRLGWSLEQAGRTVVGTFGYMPPEQLLGQAGPASDLYALGATLLHVVTGLPPTDFPFDSGRIEVPSDLPVDGSLARLIEVLLRPAPRDRPQSASSAREVLLNANVDAVSWAPRATSPVFSLVPRERSAVTLGYGPRYVDLGLGPREPKGEFRDVYSNLTNPLFPRRRLWSPGVHAVWVIMAGAYSLMSIGIAPLVYASTLHNRRSSYTELFRSGEIARGVLVSVDKGSLYATFGYEFEVAGRAHAGFMEYAQEMARYWHVGDAVQVLYDPNDPKRNCFVYR